MLTENYRTKSVFESDVFEEFPSDITTLFMGKRKNDVEMSIIIPTYKRNDTLVETIKSAIYQDTNINYEILVLDNNDDQTDYSTLEILKSRFSDKDFCYYKNQRNLGMTGNWNLAIQIAKGKYVVILHDDDKLHKDYIAVMSEIIKVRPTIGLITCYHQQIGDEDLRGIPLRSDKERSGVVVYRDESIFTSFISHTMHVCGMLFSREKAIEIGGFQEFWYPCADYVFEIRLLNKYGGAVCKMTLSDYRVLENESFKAAVSGRFPIVIYQSQGEINDKYAFLPRKIGEQYRSIYLYRYEKNLISQWCRDEREKRELELEFSKWHSEYKVERVKIWALPLYKILQKSVTVYNRLFRTKTIKRLSQ